MHLQFQLILLAFIKTSHMMKESKTLENPLKPEKIKQYQDFLTFLHQLVLSLNIFQFNSELFQQVIGTAICTRAAPTYANIFM